MPTLCALTGADAGSPLGTDLSPVLLGKKSALHDRKPLVWAGGGYGGQVAVRFDSKKVIRRNLFPGKKPDNWEVYDIVKDPAEKNNIAAENRDLINSHRHSGQGISTRARLPGSALQGPGTGSRIRERERRFHDPPPSPF